MKGLNHKQKQFIEFYLQYGNATRAAKESGYGAPKAQGSRLLTHPIISEEIRRRQQVLTGTYADKMEKVFGNLYNLSLNGKSEKTQIEASRILVHVWQKEREMNADITKITDTKSLDELILKIAERLKNKGFESTQNKLTGGNTLEINPLEDEGENERGE